MKTNQYQHIVSHNVYFVLFFSITLFHGFSVSGIFSHSVSDMLGLRH